VCLVASYEEQRPGHQDDSGTPGFIARDDPAAANLANRIVGHIELAFVLPVRRRYLTMQARKSDIDAFAQGVLDFDQFRRKVKSIAY